MTTYPQQTKQSKVAFNPSRAWIPALISLVAFLALPFGRPGRDFLTIDESLRFWVIQSPMLYIVFAAVIAVLVIALLPLLTSLRGELLWIVSGIGVTAGVVWLISTGTPFGMGALISLVAMIIVAGNGLSESGRIKSDAFVASSILFISFFIILFIIYPLFMVLRAAVIVDGEFSFSQVRAVLGSPLFLFIDNPYNTRNEPMWLSVFMIGGTVLGILIAVLRKQNVWRVLLGSLLGVLAGFFVGIMTVASGAFPTSLLLALVVAVISTLMGLAFALLGQRTRFRAIRRSLSAISLLPIITPPFILAFAMIFLFGRRGMISYDVLGISSNALFGIIGVAAAQILAFTPVAYLIIRGSVQSLDPVLEEASQTLGAGRWHLFKTVTWPLLRPGLANAFLLTVIESFADFGNPMILGGDKQYLSVEVFSALSARYNQNEAAVYGSVLLVIVLVVFFAQRMWLGQGSFVTVTGKPSSGSFAPLPRAFEALLTTIFFAWTAVVLLLYFSIIYGSFVKLWGVDGTLTLENYQDFARLGWPVFLDTAKLAAISAVPAAIVGFLIAYLVVRQKFFGRSFIEFGSMLSFATPGTVMGIAYILAFNTGPWLLTSSMAILVIAFVFRNMPVAIRGGVAGLAQIDVSLEEASTTLRANSSTTLRRVLVPLLIYALVGGLVFGFVRAMTAISQVIFLVSPGNMLATVLLLGWVEQGQLGRAAAMGTVLIVSMLIVVLLLSLLTRNRDKTAGVGVSS